MNKKQACAIELCTPIEEMVLLDAIAIVALPEAMRQHPSSRSKAADAAYSQAEEMLHVRKRFPNRKTFVNPVSDQ